MIQCKHCQASLSPEQARCRRCGTWTFTPPKPEIESRRFAKLSEISSSEVDRFKTGPWDKCFGGGIVKTSITLIGGSPGAGKSTLMLQMIDALVNECGVECIVYIAAEEEPGQIKSRADRLGLSEQTQDCIVMVDAREFDGDLTEMLDEVNPGFIILDSLPGLVGENDAAAIETLNTLKAYSSANEAPAIVIDHVTKDDSFAGRMTLQHAVDTLITFYPEEDAKPTSARVLYTKKNRHGMAFVEVKLYMNENGLAESANARPMIRDDDPSL